MNDAEAFVPLLPMFGRTMGLQYVEIRGILSHLGARRDRPSVSERVRRRLDST